MSEYTPPIPPANAYTLPVSAAVTGGRLVAVSGNGTVAHAGAASAAVIGVAAFDQTVIGGEVTVWLRGPVHEATASGAITAGARVDSAATGVVISAAAALTNVGIALTTAADTALVRYVGL